jgi:putative N6-adenine-specific DNA methylase
MGVVGSAAETPEIVIRIERDHCVVSLDVSGTPLHRRGYRRYPFRAPLREDLARALVIVSGWKGQLPLWDPFCGSGTVLIEAALWIAAYPPGLLRSFALEQTRLADPPTLQQIKADRWSWRDRLRPGVTAATDVADWRLVGVDVDGQAIAAAQQNWAAWPWEWSPRDPADSADRLPPLSARRPTVEWVVSDIRHLPLPASPIAVVTNPPWGGRIGGGRDLLPLYQRLGAWRKQSGPQGKLALVAHQRELAYRTGVPLHSAFLTDAGGIKINALIESDPQVQ